MAVLQPFECCYGSSVGSTTILFEILPSYMDKLCICVKDSRGTPMKSVGSDRPSMTSNSEMLSYVTQDIIILAATRVGESTYSTLVHCVLMQMCM